MAGRRREHGKERLAVVCATSGGDVCDPRVRIAADEVSEVVEAIVGVVLLHDAVAAYIVIVVARVAHEPAPLRPAGGHREASPRTV